MFLELQVILPLTRKDLLVIEIVILRDLVKYLWRKQLRMGQKVMVFLGRSIRSTLGMSVIG